MYLSELQNKDIINVNNGSNLGRIVDVEVSNDGRILTFIAENRKIFRKMFKNSEIEFGFGDIQKIGADCILVNK